MKWLAVVSLVLSSLLSAEEAEAVYKQGIAKLRDAQSDHAALVPATKLLARAAALYEAAGDEAKTSEVNSCLYWAKKKFTLADTQTVKTDAQVSQRIETVAKAIPASEAKAMLDKAEAFAKGHTDDPLLAAIRYFEVGDRFPETPEGRKAIQQSLAAMQKVGEKVKLEAYKPTPTDGKVFVKSEPVGAAIVFITPDGGKLDTGKVTPALVQLPVGRQSLELTLKAHKTATLAVEVDGKAIAKPDVVKMEPLTVPVDIIFEDGWTVFVDGKPAKGSGTGKVETPCTVELPLGRHDLGLAKDGFMDVRQQVEAVEGGVKSAGGMPTNSVEIKARPNKGKSILMTSPETSTLPFRPVEFVANASDSITKSGFTVTGGKFYRISVAGSWTDSDGRMANLLARIGGVEGEFDAGSAVWWPIPTKTTTILRAHKDGELSFTMKDDKPNSKSRRGSLSIGIAEMPGFKWPRSTTVEIVCLFKGGWLDVNGQPHNDFIFTKEGVNIKHISGADVSGPIQLNGVIMWLTSGEAPLEFMEPLLKLKLALKKKSGNVTIEEAVIGEKLTVRVVTGGSFASFVIGP